MVTRSRATLPRRESARQHERMFHLPVRAFFLCTRNLSVQLSPEVTMRMRSRAFLPRRGSAR